jgi:hypothetical protein
MKIKVEVCDWCKALLSHNEFQNYREGDQLALCGDCGDRKAFAEGYARAISSLGSAAKAKEEIAKLLKQYGN